MFVLRRSALRVLTKAAAPRVTVPKTRSFITLAQFRALPAYRSSVSRTPCRFASGEAETSVEAEASAAAEASAEAKASGAAEAIAEADAEAEAKPESAAETPVSSEHLAESAAPEHHANGATNPPIPIRQPYAFDGMNASNTLYVGNIFFEVTTEDIEGHFSRFGALKTARIVTDPKGLSKGFAYVEYESNEDAQRAIESTNMQEFHGRRLAVHFHRPRQVLTRHDAPNPPSKTLFIGNMSFEMSDKDLSDLFREIRNVIDVRIAIDRRTGQPRGFAHADFIDVASASKAMEYLQGKEMYGRKLRLDYSAPTRPIRPRL